MANPFQVRVMANMARWRWPHISITISPFLPEIQPELLTSPCFRLAATAEAGAVGVPGYSWLKRVPVSAEVIRTLRRIKDKSRIGTHHPLHVLY
jgi:hypothetical protein